MRVNMKRYLDRSKIISRGSKEKRRWRKLLQEKIKKSGNEGIVLEV